MVKERIIGGQTRNANELTDIKTARHCDRYVGARGGALAKGVILHVE
jgi:hypothetical protein